MKIPHVHRRDVSGGGGAELGVFPAFLWAKHAAWLALERHTRRVKHSAPSCLKAWEMELAETTVQTTGSLHVSYAHIHLNVNRLQNIKTSTVLNLIQKNPTIQTKKPRRHNPNSRFMVYVSMCSWCLFMLHNRTSCDCHSGLKDSQETAGEVLDPVTSFWVSPRCFLWSEVSNMPLTSLSGSPPWPLTPFHQSMDLNVDMTPVSTSTET